MFAVRSFVLTTVPEQLHKPMMTFMDAFDVRKLPVFYLLAKSHKGATITNDRWPSRPVVGLSRWSTTFCSVLLSTLGSLMLKLDRVVDPMNAPLLDSLDFVHRLRTWSKRDGVNDLRFTSIDFSALYTNFVWTDVLQAFSYWRCHTLTRQNQGILTPNEVLFASWLLAPISVDDFESLQASLPYLSIPHSDELSIGLVLFNFVWAHNIFHAPTEGVYRQVFGFSMGTNCAAPWANLILRYYERVNCFDKPEHPPIGVARFIDDVCLVHPSSHTPNVVSHLKSVFPPHLPFTVDVVGVTGGFNFLDVRVVSVSPLIHCVHFKETHSCNYIPFNSDTPVHIRRGWIHGECVRYLRLNSHSAFYTACLRRLRLALLRLGYPSSWFSPFPLAWSSRHMYMHRKMRPPREVVHVFKLNYNGVIRVNWGKAVKSLCYNLHQVMPALRLFCILQPSLNLRRRFHGAKIRSLLALERRIMRQVDIVDMPTQELLLNLG